jgi:hypothetical protein
MGNGSPVRIHPEDVNASQETQPITRTPVVSIAVTLMRDGLFVACGCPRESDKGKRLSYRIFTVCVVVVMAVAALVGSQRAQAQWWQDFEPKKSAGSVPGFRYTSETYGDAVSAIGSAMQRHDFVKLDRMYDEFVHDKVRASDGTWMIEAFQFTVSGWAKSGGPKPKDEAAIESFFAEWKEKSPESRLRPVAYVTVWATTAWKARGGEVASKVTPEGWEGFKRGLERAEQGLRASEDVGQDSPMWHYENFVVAASSGMPRAELDRRFEAGVARFPTFRPFYYERMNFLLPQWGGDFDQVDAFIEAAVRRTERTDGKAFYAWLYTKMAQSQCCTDIFSEARASWPRMRESYEDIMVRFPDIKNDVFYTAMACMAEDGPTTMRLMEKIKPRMIKLDLATNGMVSNSICRGVAERGVSKYH